MKSLIWTVLYFLALSGVALAQAAVEGALTHGLSGAASATAGKALGQIGNQLAGRLGQQTSNAVRPAVTNVRTQRAVRLPQAMTTTTSATSGGSMIASIQGGEPQQADTKCAAQPDAAKSPQQAQKLSECGKTKPSAEQTTHPSEITLPAPKQ
jgi:hypothetical protein